MNKLAVRLIILGVTLTIISTLNSLLLVGESQKVVSSVSFLTYNDTAYGISINYPLGWEIDESAHQNLISYLQNLSSSESQTANGGENNAINPKISEVLDAFGLEGVTDVFDLNPEKRTEFLQRMSRALNEGTSQVIVSIMSPPEDEFDVHAENAVIVAENISAASPISLNDYVKGSIEALKIVAQNLTIEPPMEITIDGKPAMAFVYTATNPEQESSTVKIFNALAMRGNTVYVLTFTSSPETYSVYLPTFEKMVQSFKMSD
jgi:hypothetical protein